MNLLPVLKTPFILFATLIVLGNSENVKDKNVKVVIIGSGLAGLAAADQLINDFGIKNVIIVEAMKRIGGRVDTVPYGDSTLPVGAEYIYGDNNPIYELAKRLNALAPPDQPTAESYESWEIYTQNGCKFQSNQIYEMLKIRHDVDNMAYSNTLKYNPASVGQSYDRAFDELEKTFSDGYPKFLMAAARQIQKKSTESKHGVSDWHKLSVHTFNKTLTKGLPLLMGPMGYKPILDHYVNRIPKENIILGSKVLKINYRQPTARLRLNTGRQLEADHVIVTSAVGELETCSSRMFDPPLPKAKTDAVKNIGFDAVDKIFLIYEKPFWSANSTAINLVRLPDDQQPCLTGGKQETESNLEKAFWYFHTKPYVNNVLTTVVVGNNDVMIVEKSNDRQIFDAVTKVLRRFLNDPTIPPPEKIMRSNWKTKPNFFGSMSYDSVECDKLKCKRDTLGQPIHIKDDDKNQKPILMFAGEATDEMSSGTTQGALMSGLREASRIKLYTDA